MKLIRLGEPGRENPGVILEDSARLDVSSFARDFDEALFADSGLSRLRLWLKENATSAPRVAHSVRLGAPIARPSKIVCIGLNFGDHARESNLEIPKEPVIFFKATPSLVGPNDGVPPKVIFDVPTLVSYVSQFMTLLPGDVISTGTPAGVGPA